MWGWNSSGSALGAIIAWVTFSIVGLIISIIVSIVKKNRQYLVFTAASIFWLLCSSIYLHKFKNLQSSNIGIAIEFILSIGFIYAAKKNILWKKIILNFLINFVILSLSIFILNNLY